MSWFKVDDKLAFHPKVIRAGNSAMGLWLRGGAWSADQATDGFIPATMIPVLGGRPSDTKALVAAGLWVEEAGGFRMHDWTDYQPTKVERDNAVNGKKAGGQLGAHRRWHKQHPSPTCEYCTGNSKGEAMTIG